MVNNDPVDISPEKDGGVLKQIIREGSSEDKPANGSKVEVHYVGTLEDGTVFDSSRERGPFEFELGKGNVIKAWDIGVATMTKGEVAMLTCAPLYAYGEAGSPPNIPPNATLKFEVEVLGWKAEDISPNKDEAIVRHLITAGDGYATPNDGAIVDVHLTGVYEGRVFDDRDVKFNLGEGGDIGIIEGVELAIEKFKRGEISRIVIHPKYAFGSEGHAEWEIPPNATVEYTINLKLFERAKQSWSMDTKEKIEQSKLYKDKGTAYFKANKLRLAIKMYKKVLKFLEQEKGSDDEETTDIKSLTLSANANLSLCHLKVNDHFEARDAATAAIKVDPNNLKAYFRRGQAYLALEEPHLAIKDFNKVLSLEPNNKAAQTQLAICQKQIRDHLQKEKRIYANMFDKFAKVDAQKEEEIRRQQPDVMKTLGEWGEEERERAPTDFEKENPNILMLNGNGEFKDM